MANYCMQLIFFMLLIFEIASLRCKRDGMDNKSNFFVICCYRYTSAFTLSMAVTGEPFTFLAVIFPCSLFCVIQMLARADQKNVRISNTSRLQVHVVSTWTNKHPLSRSTADWKTALPIMFLSWFLNILAVVNLRRLVLWQQCCLSTGLLMIRVILHQSTSLWVWSNLPYRRLLPILSLRSCQKNFCLCLRFFQKCILTYLNLYFLLALDRFQ